MKRFRMLVLMGLATAGLLAYMGSGAAMADSYCRDAVNGCYEGYGAGVPFSGTAKSATLKGTGFEMSCASSLAGQNTEYLAEGKGATNKITSLTFSGCTGTCKTASASKLPYSMLATATEGGNGTATVTSSGEGNPVVTLVECAENATCVYTTSEVPLEFKGGKGGSEVEDPRLTANGVTLTKTSGTTCPATVKLIATYIINSIGIVTHGPWRWWILPPKITWEDHNFGGVKAKETVSQSVTIHVNVEVTFESLALVNDSEGIFALGTDNCSNQKILGDCTVQVKATPKEAKVVYEATLEAPWQETKGLESGIINVRLKVEGT